MLHSSRLVLVDRRVRQMYLEFCLLAEECASLMPAGASSQLSGGRPHMYLRVEDQNCPAAAAAGGQLMAPPSAASSSADGGSVSSSPPPPHAYTYIIAAADTPRLDAHFPANWRNNTAHMAARCASVEPVSNKQVQLDAYRMRLQEEFYSNACLTVGSDEWRRALARGRYQLRRLQELIHIRKYRALRKRYNWESQLSTEELMALFDGDEKQVQDVQLGLQNKNTYGYVYSEEDDFDHRIDGHGPLNKQE